MINVCIKGQHRLLKLQYVITPTDYRTTPKELMALYLSLVLLFSGFVGGASTWVREVETGEG